MNLEMIKRLIQSHNQGDNILGYIYMGNYTFEEISGLFSSGDTRVTSYIRVDRPGIKITGWESNDYTVENKYHIHDYGAIAYIYEGNKFTSNYKRL